MAEETGDDSGGLFKGAICPVTVEECLKDILVVCLKYGSRVYRGVLMDSTKSEMPYGLGFDLLKLQCVQRSGTGSTASLDLSNQDKGAGAKISALSLRHSYQQDDNSTDLKLLPPAHVGINRPLGGKNVRSMRLRPRQVLCTKCKNRVQEGQSVAPANTSSSAATKVAHAPVKITLPVLPPSLNPEVSLTKLDLRKKRLVSDFTNNFVPKKIKTDPILGNPLAKTSPVIKISFTSPRGRGTVLKIPAKFKHEQFTEDDRPAPQNSLGGEESSELSETAKEEYKKLKKALKKAKLKEKAAEDRHHHKKSKRSKHKTKKKKRHKEVERPSHSNEDNRSDYENDQGSNQIYSGVKEPHDKEQWTVVSDYLDTGSDKLAPPGDASLRENLHNVPLKGKISRTFTSLPIRDDRPSFESSRMSTSSGNSEHSSEYDMNSECDSEDNDEAPGEHIEGGMALKVQGGSGEEGESGGEEEESQGGKLEPLMVRIKTKTVGHCLTPDGRTVCIGDVVWGKIHGFPWWPGRVTSISVSQREGSVLSQTASVSWFGSSTMSIMPCSEIHPFLQDFDLRYNKKKKGPYKTAIRQACTAAHSNLDCPSEKPLIPILED